MPPHHHKVTFPQRKILSIAPYKFLPAVNGGQKAIYYFQDAIADFFELEIISTPDNQLTGLEQFKLTGALGTSRLRYINPFLFLKLYRKIKRENLQVLLLEQVYFGWLAFLLKRLLNIRIIIRHHNIEGLRFRSLGKWWWFLMKLYEKWISGVADMNFFITATDAKFAQQDFRIDPSKTFVIPYGTNVEESPSAEERQSCKKLLLEKYNLPTGLFLILFAAPYNYKPNLDALDKIIKKINPILLKTSYEYKIIICGGSLPQEYENLETYKNSDIIYAGFVNDIDSYYKGVDLFLNPVVEGGGIKTKLVEALSLGTKAISTKSGAIGIDTKICGGMLTVVADDDNEMFAAEIQKAIVNIDHKQQIPDSFYDFFNWKKIAVRVSHAVQSITAKPV
ncbi:glycosyltransferase family 4 protein [Foetidibacter luteolus]|uniref:glycosyltransferase family 4 protein n=1 Tax=Foetidibacter luteolus TaxID=2608880 RepID=UPI00129AF524|nr:glycosyltransferase family 4 protein [Foetidibacter luteolus]